MDELWRQTRVSRLLRNFFTSLGPSILCPNEVALDTSSDILLENVSIVFESSIIRRSNSFINVWRRADLTRSAPRFLDRIASQITLGEPRSPTCRIYPSGIDWNKRAVATSFFSSSSVPGSIVSQTLCVRRNTFILIAHTMQFDVVNIGHTTAPGMPSFIFTNAFESTIVFVSKNQ